MSSGWVGVDLDGTLAEYSGWKGATEIGAPIPRMVDRVKVWLRDGQEVRIVTARVSPLHGCHPHLIEEAKAAKSAIEAWCVAQFGVALPVTAVKDLDMSMLWDDRCAEVIGNTGLSVHEVMNKFRAALEDIALYGFRADANPTRCVDVNGDIMKEIAWFYDYMRGIDARLRETARKALVVTDTHGSVLMGTVKCFSGDVLG